MASQQFDAATGAHMLGCALFDAGKLPQAQWAFSEGRRFAQHDYRFPAKLAAVQYEMGKYASAIVLIERALSLLGVQSRGPTGQNLYCSLARACLLSKNPKKARVAISQITSEHDRHSLEQSLVIIEAIMTASQNNNQGQGQNLQSLYPDETMWQDVIQRLPKCRARIEDRVPFLPITKRHVRALVDTNSSLLQTDQEDYSFLFVDSGDARDVFATLSSIGCMVEQNQFPSTKHFYFTLVDPHPASFARNLLMFRMLTDWATESQSERHLTEAALAYILASQLLPSWAYGRLQRAMVRVSYELQKDGPLIMGCFCIDKTTRDSISSHLGKWQDHERYPFTTQEIFQMTRWLLSQRVVSDDYNPEVPPEPREVCEPYSLDSLYFRNSNFMLPPWDVVKEIEPEIVNLGREYRSALDDLEYSTGNLNSTRCLDFTPQEVARHLFWYVNPEKEGKLHWGAFDYLVSFFSTTAKWFEKMQGKTTIKMIANDATNVMELAALHLLGNDHPPIPDRYDGIDMNCLPDWVGGPMATFTYGIPILRHDEISTVQAYVSLSRNIWTTQDQFLTEFLLLADRRAISDIFTTTLTERSSCIEAKILSMEEFKEGGEFVMMPEPFNWVRTKNNPISWDKIMPRDELVKWLHMHFLKLCLPPRRNKFDGDFVFMSLNMTAFFRLITHLSRIGYPSHWLSEVLTELHSGQISSQARAPELALATKSEVMRIRPKRDVFIEPFMGEFRTHFAIWNRLLRFGILQNPEITIQQVDTIREYRQRFPSIHDGDVLNIYHPVITLVLWNVSLNGEIPRDGLRQTLLDDEYTDPKYQGISRQIGRVHIISTVKIVTSSMSVSFWFANEPIQNLLSTGDRWEAWLWDINDWTPKFGPARVDRVTLIHGEAWCLSGGR
ncbi:hypothetical protein F5B19DRAFT_502463 [Rostrohypoxylon terebratum]|nr:hypothetical protein F5B19DRAFT_502463 [Rostrohypoxylon terebratum]